MRSRAIALPDVSVRAILDGRKTQTRKVVKLPPYVEIDGQDVRTLDAMASHCDEPTGTRRIRCPYGVPGDVLWVQEVFSPDHKDVYPFSPIVFRATADLRKEDWKEHVTFDCEREYKRSGWPGPECLACVGFRWRSSTQMPREASRLSLRVLGVRVERAQDISEEDARAEGVDAVSQEDVPRQAAWTHRQDFAVLWDTTNAASGFGWATNPWVWALTFERMST